MCADEWDTVISPFVMPELLKNKESLKISDVRYIAKMVIDWLPELLMKIHFSITMEP